MKYSDYPGIKIPYKEQDIEHLMALILALGKVLDSGNLVTLIQQATAVVDERFSMVTQRECQEMNHYNAWCKQVGLT